jgi:hypothetical protein
MAKLLIVFKNKNFIFPACRQTGNADRINKVEKHALLLPLKVKQRRI